MRRRPSFVRHGAAADPIKVISYNIRMSAAPDADGDNRWENASRHRST